MDISSMFRRALGLIPSVASTAKNSFTRVLSLTGSFNDRTSLLRAVEPVPPGLELELELAPPPSQLQEARVPVTTSDTLDMEAATQETLIGGGSGNGGQGEEPTAQDADAKRMAKTVQTVCLFAASASLMLFANLPSKPSKSSGVGPSAVLYSVDMAFICLGLFTSLGLSMFSIMVKSGSDLAVARVQKRTMVMAVAFVLVSFTLRTCMMLPAASLESAWLVFVLLAGAVAMYLALTWKFGAGRIAAIASVSGGGVPGHGGRQWTESSVV